MKVLGIVCSPRKGGNTEILVEAALAAAREAGAETDIFLVAGKTIGGCQACHNCHKHGVCKLNDDMQALYPKMEAADAFVFGSPVYFHGVTAQAKAVIDRTFYFLKGRRLKGKIFAPVLALRRVGGGQTRSYLHGYAVAQAMIPVNGAIGYGREPGDVTNADGGGIGISAMDEARAAGQEVVEMYQRLTPPEKV